MGDVALAVPVVKQVLQQNPGLLVTVVSSAGYQPLFAGLEGCQFFPAYLKDRHKGTMGIYRLFRDLLALPRFDAIVDLHSVLRSLLLGALFTLTGIRSWSLDKGRAEKKALTRREGKVMRPLKPMSERYAEVFRKAGLQARLEESTQVYAKRQIPFAAASLFNGGKKVIGVAPFAQYRWKTYPPAKMKRVIQQLAAENNTILLFGSAVEAAILKEWERDIASVYNIAGEYSLPEEMAIISHLDAMVSMDSANMHLASLFHIPVVSVWGATHPFSGFYGWGQDTRTMVQVDLYCRPCSVFGNKPCYRGDHACMNWLKEAAILEKVLTAGNLRDNNVE